mgnify:FL=1|jgi:hypothetical protein|tara:strand:+ start:3450 stop:3890 length:441 start_codon:yes stop_codon:yes gene_type:complete
MNQIHIIISRSTVPLWENPIPDSLYKFIYTFSKNITRKNQIHHLSRHHPVLVQAFRYFYGTHLDKCQYAGIKSIATDFINYYEVKQIFCYGNAPYPESIDLHTELWLPDIIHKINRDDRLTQIQKRFFINESKQFARNKSTLFLDF